MIMKINETNLIMSIELNSVLQADSVSPTAVFISI